LDASHPYWVAFFLIVIISDIVTILAAVKGQQVPFTTITTEAYIDAIVAKGEPRPIA
jgi:hypothetical protein